MCAAGRERIFFFASVDFPNRMGEKKRREKTKVGFWRGGGNWYLLRESLSCSSQKLDPMPPFPSPAFYCRFISPFSHFPYKVRFAGNGGANLDHKFVIFNFEKWSVSIKSETYSFSNMFSFFLEKYAKPLLRVRHSPSSSPPQVKVWAVLVVAGSYETTSFWQILLRNVFKGWVGGRRGQKCCLYGILCWVGYQLGGKGEVLKKDEFFPPVIFIFFYRS